jgi:hypothetical protein
LQKLQRAVAVEITKKISLLSFSCVSLGSEDGRTWLSVERG